MDSIKRTDKLEERLMKELSVEELFNALSKALSYDTKEEYYKYIARMYEVNIVEDTEDF